MYKVILRKSNKERRKLRVRSNIFGTLERPRLSVFRSNKYITAQLIDDANGVTLADTLKETKDLHVGKTKVEAAKEVGLLLAKKAVEAKITKVTFDRNGNRYHGRVKNVAEGAREGGLQLWDLNLIMMALKKE